ncbi:MAG TPA: NADH-quinone oxidoreductase subunit L [Kouleothrix sp.]|uniref:NADH-quinone oxidoreductase subunit L n=1 Tax=Kouleothrix sp. TaxID=2779161 RepID=UPI002C79BA9A|nr:NADH-quinone oxidoreductase subunit L [Kouleothrix sp.]HRC74214.1 NADH-quinone oxidoreductase subunit L [Kouleothrix sp.]
MSDLTWIVVLIPAFPLLGFLLNTFVIRNERQAGLLASAMVALSFVATLASIAVLQSLQVAGAGAEAAAEAKHHIDFVLWEWMTIGTFRVPFGLLFDQLTAVMALLVTGVGGLIHVFSIGYMHGDARPVRYFAYLNLFIVAMLFLIMGDNLLLLFLGWEGVGLCSFLLISHWFDRKSVPPGIVPSEAAVKAFVANRVGDAGMLLAMMAIFASLGTLTFYGQAGGDAGYLERTAEVGRQVVNVGILGQMSILTLITLLMLVGVTGKSAQVPLFVWLPDAMAGPTPVSALIHAATMVTSGVYLIARNHTLFSDLASGTAPWVVGIGVLTALLAASAAVTQWDIKRVLAYSTVSQLGYMVAAVGMGAYVAGMFHLLTHGVFKALLFLGSASIIHGTHETQDMRRMGGLRAKMPTTFWTYMVGALALAGIFPFAGFWSKDEIIAQAFDTGSPLTGIVLIISSLLTAFYMGRQVALVFWGKPRDAHAEHAHESTGGMKIVLIILGVGAIIAGVMNLPGLHWLDSYLHPVLGEEPAPYTIGKGVLAAVVTLLAGASMYGGWYLYARVLEAKIKPGKDDPGFRYAGDIWRGAELAWGFDWFYSRVIVRGYRMLAGFLASVFDQQGIDGILVDGVGRVFGSLASLFRRGQTGYIRNYAWVFFVGVVVLVGYFAFV